MGIHPRSAKTFIRQACSFYPKNLRVLNPTLFANVAKVFPFEDVTALATIDLMRLDEDIRTDLASVLPLLGKMPAPGSVEENTAFNNAQIDIARRNAEEEAKRQALEDSGHAQINAYRKVGLQDTPRNAEIIRTAIENRGRGIFCSTSVRNAVEAERSNLEWGKPVSAAPVAPPPQPVELLPSGEPRLPLGTIPARHHSIAQLRDLDARQRASRSRHAGTFGARF
jgi:hypothetical protein